VARRRRSMIFPASSAPPFDFFLVHIQSGKEHNENNLQVRESEE
jgi:hypothetical protein